MKTGVIRQTIAMKLSRIKTKKLLLAAAFLFGLFGVFLIGYIVVVSYHVDRVMTDHLDQAKIRTFGLESELEKETFVNKTDLNFYLLTSGAQKSPEEWKEELDISEAANGKYLINETFRLPPSLKNDCEVIYCYQHRVGFERIPSLLWRGLIGIEDVRFVHHAGIDFKSILRAIVVDIKEMRFAQGGSTITQQLVKNLFFSNERSLIRKLKEVVYAIYLESQYSKDEILNAYFNEVFWGTIGGIKIKGFFAASVAFFHKRPEELTDYEVAILVSLLKGPYHYSPVFNPERLKSRAKVVFNKLKELNFVVDSDEPWSNERFDRWTKKVLQNHRSKLTRDLFKYLSNDQKVLSGFEHFVFLRSITKTAKVLEKRIEGKDVAVKAIIAPIDCKDNCQYFSYYSKFERDKDKAINDEQHQVGSILKPLFYQIILNNDKKLTEMVSTEPITLKLLSGSWTPKDASKVKEPEVTLLYALRKSKNIPLIRLSNEIGFDKIENEAILYLPQLKTPLGEYPAQMLGAVELSVKEAYETFNQYIRTECIKMADNEYHFERSLMHLLSDHETTTISKVVFRELRQVPFFGKTGTTNKGLDSWYVAYDGKYIYVIWFGLEGDRREQVLRLSGASSSFRIFQYFLIDRGKRYPELGCPELSEY
jgi:penicillin-binding protein 1B